MSPEKESHIVVERPTGVWVIAIGNTLLFLFTTTMLALYWINSDVLPASGRQNFDSLGRFWWVGSLVLQTLAIAGTWTLFTLRRTTLRWWVASLTYTVVATIYNVLLTPWGWTVIPSIAWLPKVVGDVADLVIYAYAKQLRARGVLR